MKISSKGLELIKKFEGLKLESYKCPAGVDTIGYGHTGQGAEPGSVITEEEAENFLIQDVLHSEMTVSSCVKIRLNQSEYDSLVSFTYNVGSSAFTNSTLLRLLNLNTDRVVVAAEFERWVKAGSDEPVPGLVRRRKAEKELFLTKTKHPLMKRSILAKKDTWLKYRPVDSTTLDPQEKLFVPKGSAWEWSEIRMYAGEKHQKVYLLNNPEKSWWLWPDHWKVINDVDEPIRKFTKEIKLSVPYFSQRDNEKDPYRTCFSSSCAMLLACVKPDVIQNDDEYVTEIFELGDTTEAWVQIQALKNFGVESKFVQNATWDTIEKQLKKGLPIPIGILHKGPVNNPSGAGHWICCVGITADREKLWVHDPFGDLNLVIGGYESADGAYKLYSKKNLGPRWLVEGDSSGWAVLAE